MSEKTISRYCPFKSGCETGISDRKPERYLKRTGRNARQDNVHSPHSALIKMKTKFSSHKEKFRWDWVQIYEEGLPNTVNVEMRKYFTIY